MGCDEEPYEEDEGGDEVVEEEGDDFCPVSVPQMDMVSTSEGV